MSVSRFTHHKRVSTSQEILNMIETIYHLCWTMCQTLHLQLDGYTKYTVSQAVQMYKRNFKAKGYFCSCRVYIPFYDYD